MEQCTRANRRRHPTEHIVVDGQGLHRFAYCVLVREPGLAPPFDGRSSRPPSAFSAASLARGLSGRGELNRLDLHAYSDMRVAGLLKFVGPAVPIALTRTV